MTAPAPPEYNMTGQDYADRRHFVYGGPLVDAHTHLTLTHPAEGKEGPPPAPEPAALAQAEQMVEVAREFGVTHICTMAPAEDIAPLRERFGTYLSFNAIINRKVDDTEDIIYRQVDQFLQQRVDVIKFWAAPRGRDRGLFVDAPWRLETARRAIAAGVKLFMVHVGDPDAWFRTTYTDVAKYGTKESQYDPFYRVLEMFPNVTWIAAHLGGDPEHPDHLEAMLERFPYLYFDTSATKWVVREVSPRAAAFRSLICRYPTRFLFGSDLVTRHGLTRAHYVSRYWCQRTLWESTWQCRSPIADPDHVAAPGEPPTPLLQGVGLPPDVLKQVYFENGKRLLLGGE